MKKMPLIGVALLGLAVLGGCSNPAEEHTNGELGKVEFSYRASCFLGCDLQEPVLSGSTERVALSGPGNDAGLCVRSTAPGVASFSVERVCSCDQVHGTTGESYAPGPSGACNTGYALSCRNYVDVQTGESGDAKLELVGSAGETIDRATVHVRAAEQIGFERIPAGKGGRVESLTLSAGDSVELRALALSGATQLLGTHGFSWHLDDAQVASFDYWSDAALDAAPDDARVAALRAVSPGTTTLHVGAGGAEGRLLIVVK
jgi:hypothetical protein